MQDGTQKLFFNATASEFADSELLREFLQYLTGKPAENDAIKKIDDYVKTVKSNQKWRLDYMAFCAREQDLEIKYYERGIKQGMQQGEKTGVRKGSRNVAKKLLRVMNDFDISEMTELPIEEVREIRRLYSQDSPHPQGDMQS